MMMSDDLSLSRKRRTADLRGRRYDRDQFAIFFIICAERRGTRESRKIAKFPSRLRSTMMITRRENN